MLVSPYSTNAPNLSPFLSALLACRAMARMSYPISPMMEHLNLYPILFLSTASLF